MQDIKTKIYNICPPGIMLIGIIIEIAGFVRQDVDLFVIGLLCLWICNVADCIKDFRGNFVFMFFQISLFTFLMSRPAIGLFSGEDWQAQTLQSSEGIWFALKIISMTEIALFAGKKLFELAEYAKKKKQIPQTAGTKEINENFRECLQLVSMIAFYVFMVFYLVKEFEPLLVIGTENYLQYYSNFESSLPGFVHTFASFMKYSFALFLATLPGKRKAFFPLALYVVSTLPSLMIGVRNPFILSVLFCLIYYVIRDRIGDVKKWIGKVEKALICIGIPVGLVFMGVYASIRLGASNVSGMGNPFQIIARFFYGQGVSFNVLSIGYGYKEGLKIIKPVSYTFGGFIDYIYRGTIGQKVFGTEPLTSYNSEFNALNSNNLSHALSKMYLKEEYLEGRGVGSSYLLETYIDFGYIGIIVFSVILGAVLVFLVKGIGKNALLNTIMLVSMMNVLFVPRAEATGWLTFIITIQFWFCIGACYAGAFVCDRLKIFQKIRALK